MVRVITDGVAPWSPPFARLIGSLFARPTRRAHSKPLRRLEALEGREVPVSYWVGEVSTDARDARNWYPYNTLPSPGDDLFFYGGGAAGNFDEDIDGDIDSRPPGNSCMGLTGNWNSVEIDLGYMGTITLGANPSSWSVGTPMPTPPTPTPFDGPGVTFVQLLYNAPGANIAQFHPLTGEVSPLTITGNPTGWVNPLPASLTWYGGALNDTAVASTVTVTGTTALIEPNGGAGVGAVTTGSTLNYVSADVTVEPGTVTFSNPNVSFIMDLASTAAFHTALAGITFAQDNPAANTWHELANTTFSGGGGASTFQTPVRVIGRVELTDSATVNCTGGAANGPVSIVTALQGADGRGIIIRSGSTLRASHKVAVLSGGTIAVFPSAAIVNTPNNGPNINLQRATVDGTLVVEGGRIYLFDPAVNP